MAVHSGEDDVDTVIIGNGPSALILSYILHGHVPYYVGGYEDHLLDAKLVAAPDLTCLTPAICDYQPSSSSYSTQALPVNALLDSLIRPNGETTFLSESCVEWRHLPERAVSHIVLGNAPHAGGQWADNPVKASWEIGTLSYGEQLNLPGYSLAEHWQRANGEPLQAMTHPTRNELADYLRAYPVAVGIQDTIRNSVSVSNIRRKGSGFYVEPLGISCRHLVLASGIFNISLPPPSSLTPLVSLSADQGPVVVVGSGFTAADIIISTPPHRKIIHLFNWDPVDRPSPLKACHTSAYPEYAWIYRQMRLAVDRTKGQGQRKGSLTGAATRPPPSSSTLYFNQRDWSATYEGYANSSITSVSLESDNDTATSKAAESCNGTNSTQHRTPSATLHIKSSSTGLSVVRTITSFRYATGRRGSLAYLSPALQHEVLHRATTSTKTTPSTSPRPLKPLLTTAPEASDPHFATSRPSSPNSTSTPTPSHLISRLTLREKIEESTATDAAGLELAPDVFAIGSLTGDSLIRFAYGGCVVVAGAIGARQQQLEMHGHGAGATLDRRKDERG